MKIPVEIATAAYRAAGGAVVYATLAAGFILVMGARHWLRNP